MFLIIWWTWLITNGWPAKSWFTFDSLDKVIIDHLTNFFLIVLLMIKKYIYIKLYLKGYRAIVEVLNHFSNLWYILYYYNYLLLFFLYVISCIIVFMSPLQSNSTFLLFITINQRRKIKIQVINYNFIKTIKSEPTFAKS